MKKILVSQKDIDNINSGVPKKVLQELKTFNKLGYESYAIAENLDSKLIQSYCGVPVKTFRWPISGYFRRLFYAKRVQAWIDSNKPDLVIGHGGIFEQDICFIHNCVHLAHEKINNENLPEDHPVGRIHDKILTDQKFKLLICNSKKMQDDLCERFNIPREITHVIYPEFDDTKFNLNQKEFNRVKFRNELNIFEDTVVIGLITSGNLKKRNFGLLLEAVKKLREENIKVVVTGASRKDPYREEVKNLGLENTIIFLPIINNVDFYFHGIDIFVLPAFFEEFGRSALEAMSLKLPVILSSYVGASEILEGESRDFIIENFEVDNFTKKLQTLINDKELRSNIGDLNKETSKKYNATVQNQKFIDLITSKGLI